MKTKNPMERFSGQVSWIKSYALINEDKSDWKKGTLHSLFDIYCAKTIDHQLIYFAVTTANNIKDLLQLLNENSYNEQFWVMVEDKVDKKLTEDIFRTSVKQQTIVCYLDTESEIYKDSPVYQILDGLDWQKSFTSGKATYSWE